MGSGGRCSSSGREDEDDGGGEGLTSSQQRARGRSGTRAVPPPDASDGF